MAEKDEKDAELSKQIEQLALSIKERAGQNASEEAGTSIESKQDFINSQIEAFKKQVAQKGPGGMSKKDWAFWNTQPVPKFDEEITDEDMGPIEGKRDNVRKEPYSLPNGFEWDTVDINNKKDLEELYNLLNENYVEDDDNMFRFDYSPEFLRWALTPPGWKTPWLCAVRAASKNKKMVGFISAIPATIQVKNVKTQMVEINFLCVHKRLRSKRLAPTLIREITRRVNLEGIFQACYTAGVVIPKPVGTARYHHRSLNPKKLVDIQFSSLTKNQTMNRLVRLMKVPEQTSIPGLRPMVASDSKKACELLCNYLSKFNLAPTYTEEEFNHWFMPRKGVVTTYVVENAEKEITDFASFYSLPSTVVNHKQYQSLYAAYSFYNVSQRLTKLMRDMLTIAKRNDFDVFNALDLMDNKEFLKELKFGEGDGNLNYYLYNWRCPKLPKEELGLVLL